VDMARAICGTRSQLYVQYLRSHITKSILSFTCFSILFFFSKNHPNVFVSIFMNFLLGCVYCIVQSLDDLAYYVEFQT